MSATALMIPDDDSIGKMSDGDFAALFGGVVSEIADRVVIAVHLCRVRLKAGHATLPINGIWKNYVPKIIAGSTLAETVSALLRAPTKVLSAVASLPVADQRRLVIEGKPVEVWERATDGKPTVRKVPVGALQSGHVAIAFGDGYLREAAEQIAILTAPKPEKPKPATVKRGKVTAYHDTQQIKIGDSLALWSEVKAAAEAVGLH